MQNIKLFQISLICLVFGLFPLSSQAVDIIFTTNTCGQIENCRCPADPNGAMEKRSAEINRRRSLGDLVLFDSGDFCSESIDTLQSSTVIDVMKYIGYDAVGIGDQELYQGKKLLQKMVKELPLVCANLYYANGKPVAEPLRVIKRGNQTFAVTAVIDQATCTYLPEKLKAEFIMKDPVESVLSAISKAPAGARIIVLSHAGTYRDRNYAQKWEGVDLIIGGHNGAVIEGIDAESVIPLVQAGAKGRYIGIAQLKGSRVKAEVIPLKPELPDDAKVIEMYMKYKSAKRKLTHH